MGIDKLLQDKRDEVLYHFTLTGVHKKGKLCSLL
jgi:hypothetical protein